MAKTKISEFSSTPGNNTDIDSINLAEGCAPSGINDAIRELMAQLKDFQTGAVGDSFNGPVGTITAAAGAFTTLTASSTATLNTLASSGATLTGGTINGTTIGGTTAAAVSATTLTTSSTVTHNGGTANGVAYLNGSKVLTTGSALTYNGTNLSLDAAGSGPAYLEVSQRSRFGYDGTNVFISDAGTGKDIVFTRITEQMRLTSTGLGIGTSSPATKLEVFGSVASGVVAAGVTNTDASGFSVLRLRNTGASGRDYQIGVGGNTSGQNGNLYVFDATAAAVRLTLDSSGNLGLGVTPSAWASSFPALQFAQGVSVSQGGFGVNTYFNSGFRYVATGAATLYQPASGAHIWYNAPSGTAGNAISFTQALSLTAAGNLLLGGTTDPGGTKVLYIGNGTTPGTPTSGGVLYVESGALKYKGSSGTVTTLGAA